MLRVNFWQSNATELSQEGFGLFTPKRRITDQNVPALKLNHSVALQHMRAVMGRNAVQCEVLALQIEAAPHAIVSGHRGNPCWACRTICEYNGCISLGLPRIGSTAT